MRIVHDDCKRVLESLHDNGVYLVDKDRLTIYYMGEDSLGLLNPGLVHAASEPRREDAGPAQIARVEADSLGMDRPPSASSGSADRDRWTLISELQSAALEPSQLLATIAPVKDEHGVTVGAVQVFDDHEEICRIRARLEELERMVLLDPLTRVGNRRYAEIQLQCCLDEMRRYGWPFGALFIDVDHFKSINDRFGHTAGDAALRVTANTLVTSLRSSDLVCRWGGEEFVIVLKNMGSNQIGPVAEKLRSLVAQSCILTDQGSLKLTISVGATVALSDDSVASLIHRADKLMYRSKRKGRNCVTTDADEALV